MSGLTFREQAAIALRTCVIRTEASHFGNDVTVYNEGTCSADDAAREAQALAYACCKSWGHDRANDDRQRCKRCGEPIR